MRQFHKGGVEWLSISVDYFWIGFAFCCEFTSQPLWELLVLNEDPFLVKPHLCALYIYTTVACSICIHTLPPIRYINGALNSLANMMWCNSLICDKIRLWKGFQNGLIKKRWNKDSYNDFVSLFNSTKHMKLWNSWTVSESTLATMCIMQIIWPFLTHTTVWQTG